MVAGYADGQGARASAGVSASATATAAATTWGMGAILSALALSACFDVQKIDPGKEAFVISDFEQGQAVANSALFDRWFCITFNPQLGQDPGQTVTCAVEDYPGDQSQFGLMATFALHNGLPDAQYAGATLMTIADDAAVDFNGFQYLSFKLRVEFGGPPPPTAQVDVQLGCNSVAGQDTNDHQEYFDLFHLIAATPTWSTFQLPLSSFMQRMDETNLFKGGPKACLGLVDSVRFEVNALLMQGQSASGTLHIDDVRLEGPV